jgi:hypothetical protein
MTLTNGAIRPSVSKMVQHEKIRLPVGRNQAHLCTSLHMTIWVLWKMICGAPFLPALLRKVQSSKFKVRSMPTRNFSCFTGGPKVYDDCPVRKLHAVVLPPLYLLTRGCYAWLRWGFRCPGSQVVNQECTRLIEACGCPGAKIPIYFLKILDYHISKPQGCHGAIWGATLR